MTTRHHTPSDNTTPYTAELDESYLVVTYILRFDGEVQIVTREYFKVGGEWHRYVGDRGWWKRIYTPANPPTTPPSGTYVVQERTDEGWVNRETGTWHD